MGITELPDLGPANSAPIVADNVRATGAIFFASKLEELKLFQVADRLVGLFLNGLIPTSTKSAGRNLYQYWRETPLRLTSADRTKLYARVLGVSGGDGDVVPNREFNDLWIRFISAVSALSRQDPVDVNEYAVAESTARTAGRELAQNLSLHGHGIALYAATDLNKQTNQILNLLRDKEIQQAYGARDIWQVIDEVAKHELGGAANVIRYRTMASAGATIINWLANRSRKLAPSSRIRLLSLKKTRAVGDLSVTNSKNPSDADLVGACEQWLAVSGIPDDSSGDFN